MPATSGESSNGLCEDFQLGNLCQRRPKTSIMAPMNTSSSPLSSLLRRNASPKSSQGSFTTSVSVEPPNCLEPINDEELLSLHNSLRNPSGEELDAARGNEFLIDSGPKADFNIESFYKGLMTNDAPATTMRFESPFEDGLSNESSSIINEEDIFVAENQTNENSLSCDGLNFKAKVCDYCSRRFLTWEEYEAHAKEIHGIVNADEVQIGSNGSQRGALKRGLNDDSSHTGEDNEELTSPMSKWKMRKYSAEVISTAKSQESVKWVANIWNTWIATQNPNDQVSSGCTFENLFRSYAKSSPVLLSRFAEQCRQSDGKEYSLRTLYSIFSIMQMYLNNEKIPINIFKDENFKTFQRGLHDKMKPISRTLTAKSSMKKGVITEDLEKQLWDRGVLSVENPMKLLRTVFFLVGKYFNLASRQDHRNLRSGVNSQIKVVGSGSEERIEFFDDSLFGKDCGDFKRPTIRKIGGPNCPVGIIKFYLSKLPAYAVAFYCKPRQDFSEDWYYNQPIGVNTLSKIVESIARDAGWDTSVNWSGAYVCSICQRSFRFQCNLSYHMKFHFLDKPHKCNFCLKGFASKTMLWNHKKEAHQKDVHYNPKPKRPLTDEVTGSQQNSPSPEFHTPPELSSGLPLNLSQKETPLTHTSLNNCDSKNYKCIKCGVQLTQSNQIIRHLEAHILGLEKLVGAYKNSASSISNQIPVSITVPTVTQVHRLTIPTITTPINNHADRIVRISPRHGNNGQLVSSENDCKLVDRKPENVIDMTSSSLVSEDFSILKHANGNTLLLCPVLCQCGPCDEMFGNEKDLNDHVLSHSSIEDPSKCKNCEMDISTNEEAVTRLDKTVDSATGMKSQFVLPTVASVTSGICLDDSLTQTVFKVESQEFESTTSSEQTHSLTSLPPALSLANTAPSMVVNSNNLPVNSFLPDFLASFDSAANDEFVSVDDSDKNVITCKKCNKQFSDRNSAERHRKQHVRDERVNPLEVNGSSFMCVLCNIPFRSSDDLSTHEKWHDNGEPLQCEFCKVILSSRLSLKRHILHVHVTLKEHQCSACNASFDRSSHLSKHKREAHGLC